MLITTKREACKKQYENYSSWNVIVGRKYKLNCSCSVIIGDRLWTITYRHKTAKMFPGVSLSLFFSTRHVESSLMDWLFLTTSSLKYLAVFVDNFESSLFSGVSYGTWVILEFQIKLDRLLFVLLSRYDNDLWLFAWPAGCSWVELELVVCTFLCLMLYKVYANLVG